MDSQVDALVPLAVADGFDVPPEYIIRDDGYLGGEADRPGFVHAHELARLGLVSRIYCYSLDRWVRGLALQMFSEEELEKCRVELKCATENDDTSTGEGRMMRQMRGVFAEYEKYKIKERTTRGRRKKAERGFRPGGKAPFGYRHDGDALVIVPDQAAIVRQLFGWAEQGVRMQHIAQRLHAQGTKPIRARQWDYATVRKILYNRTYLGEACYGKHQRAEPARRRKPAPAGKSKKTSLRRRPETEWLNLVAPRIISDEQFARAQAQLAQYRGRFQGRPSSRYQMRGLVVCGACGRACVGNGTKRNAYYQCSNIDRLNYRRICPARRIRADVLETRVMAELGSTAPSLLAKLEAHARRGQSAAREAEAERKAILQNIDRLKAREDNAADAILDADLADKRPKFKAALKAAQTERKALEARLGQLTPTLALPSLADLERFRAIVAEGMDTLDQRQVFEHFIERVEVAADHSLRITFKGDTLAEVGYRDKRVNDVGSIRHPGFTVEVAA
jgi:site-specific DNA recombinase